MKQSENDLIQQNIVSPESENEIDLLGLIQILGEEKWLLFGIPFLCACISAVISLYLTPIYIAKASFVLPDKQSSTTSAVLDQLGGLGGLANNLSKSPTEMYVALMQSNAVQDEILAELDLMQRYQMKTQEDARKKLLGMVKITTDKKSGVITIEAQDPSPDISAKLANAYLKPFRAILNRMSLDEANYRRDFFAQQIEIIARRPFRDPFVQSTLMNSLIRQYEASRIDEMRQSQVLFQVDVAKPPEKRSSPKRLQIVFLTLIVTFLLTFLWIFFKALLRRAQADPALSPKLVLLKKTWKLRS